MLLQVLYSVRSERALMNQMDLHLGFRWFVGLSLSEAVWDASTFSKNRERLLGGDIAVEFLTAVVAEARRKHWLSDERFTVDGTLIEAWASKSSYRPKDDPPAPGQGSGRRGELQKRDLFRSTTDPEAHLDSIPASKTGAPLSAHLFKPRKDRFDAFAAALRVVIGGVPGGSPIDTAAALTLILRHLRRGAEPAQAFDKHLFVVAFVGGHLDASPPHLQIFEQLHRCFAFGLGCGRGHARAGDQALLAIAQHVAQVTQPRHFARAFAIQAGPSPSRPPPTICCAWRS